jgi:hypothetical protein
MAQTFKNARASLGTSATDVYTCPANTKAIIIGCQIANADNSSRTVQLWWTDSSASSAITHLGYNVTIPVGSAYEPISGKVVLEAGDKLVGLGSTASSLNVTLSVLEIS